MQWNGHVTVFTNIRVIQCLDLLAKNKVTAVFKYFSTYFLSFNNKLYDLLIHSKKRLEEAKKLQSQIKEKDLERQIKEADAEKRKAVSFFKSFWKI